MKDLAEMRQALELMEGRVTLLERKLAHAAPPTQPDPGSSGPVADELHLGCQAPGLLITHVHPAEHDEAGIPFCWIGNDGPLQFVIPDTAARPLSCVLRLRPHPSVGLDDLSVVANDEPRAHTLTAQGGGTTEIRFDVPRNNAGALNVQLLGVRSVRPSDFGENSDLRLLAARFYGVDIVYS